MGDLLHVCITETVEQSRPRGEFENLTWSMIIVCVCQNPGWRLEQGRTCFKLPVVFSSVTDFSIRQFDLCILKDLKTVTVTLNCLCIFKWSRTIKYLYQECSFEWGVTYFPAYHSRLSRNSVPWQMIALLYFPFTM